MSSPVDYNRMFASVAKSAAIVDRLNAVRGVSLPVWAQDVASAYGTGPTTEASNRSVRQAQAAIESYAQSVADQAASGLVDAVDAVSPLPSRTLSRALEALGAIMARDGQSVVPGSVGATWTPDDATHGTALAVVSGVDGRGIPASTSFAEAIRFTGSGSGLAFEAQRAAPGRLDPSYPAGSGTSGVVPLVAPSQAPGPYSRQLLNNGEFDLWAGGLPSSWRLLGGTAGTTITQSSPDYSGDDALTFVGDGTSRSGIQQGIGTDTPSGVFAGDLVAVCLFARLTGAPTQGILEIGLVDASGATIVCTDGRPCSATWDLTQGLGGWGLGRWGEVAWGGSGSTVGWGAESWGYLPWGAFTGPRFVPLTGTFPIPDPKPADMRFAVRLSTPLPTGASLTVDRLAMAAASPLYPGGPLACFFAGLEPPRAGYAATLRVANDMAGSYAWAFDRLFATRSYGFSLPSSSRPSIPSPPPPSLSTPIGSPLPPPFVTSPVGPSPSGGGGGGGAGGVMDEF